MAPRLYTEMTEREAPKLPHRGLFPRQEAAGEWSVYLGLAYIKGPFRTLPEANAWIFRHEEIFPEVPA